MLVSMSLRLTQGALSYSFKCWPMCLEMVHLSVGFVLFYLRNPCIAINFSMNAHESFSQCSLKQYLHDLNPGNVAFLEKTLEKNKHQTPV